MPDTLQFTYSQNYENLELGKDLLGQSFATGMSLAERMKTGEDSNIGGTIKAALQAAVGSAGGVGKAIAYEGGFGLGTAGAVVNQLSSTIDILPTIAAITQTKLSNHKIDGVDLSALIKGNLALHPRETFYYY